MGLWVLFLKSVWFLYPSSDSYIRFSLYILYNILFMIFMSAKYCEAHYLTFQLFLRCYSTCWSQAELDIALWKTSSFPSQCEGRFQESFFGVYLIMNVFFNFQFMFVRGVYYVCRFSLCKLLLMQLKKEEMLLRGGVYLSQWSVWL